MESPRLDALGWSNFEKLCQAILVATYGGDFQSWGGSGDLGRDAYCPSDIKWKNHKLPGPVVVQAKFVANANAKGAEFDAALKTAITAEMNHVKARLGKKVIELPKSYILFTNAPVGSTARRDLEVQMQAAIPGAKIKLVTGNDIATWLNGLPEVRQSFPLLLGLEDFEKLIASAIDRGLAEKSRIALSLAHKSAITYVETEAYFRAKEALDLNHFVILAGPPEIGKTTTAQILALEAVARGFDLVFCQDPDTEFFPAATGLSPKVFVVDDAFGSNEYRPQLGEAWARVMDLVLEVLGPTKKIIFTSRSTPLKLALDNIHLQPSAERFRTASVVLFTMEGLTKLEKARILYSHAKALSLGQRWGQRLTSEVNDLVATSHFTPYRAWSFCTELSTEHDTSDQSFYRIFKDHFMHSTRAMEASLNNLDASWRNYLFATLDTKGSWSRREIEAAVIRIFPDSLDSDLKSIGESLLDHFLKPHFWGTSVSGMTTYVHPTWRDLLIRNLSRTEKPKATFLSACGLNGISALLGLSDGALAEDRLTPELSARDWTLLAASVRRLAEAEAVSAYDWVSLLVQFRLLMLAKLHERPLPEEIRSFAVALLETAADAYYKTDNPQEINLAPNVLAAFAETTLHAESSFRFDVTKLWKKRVEMVEDALILEGFTNNLVHHFDQFLDFLNYLGRLSSWLHIDIDRDTNVELSLRVLREELRFLTEEVKPTSPEPLVNVIAFTCDSARHLFSESLELKRVAEDMTRVIEKARYAYARQKPRREKKYDKEPTVIGHASQGVTVRFGDEHILPADCFADL